MHFSAEGGPGNCREGLHSKWDPSPLNIIDVNMSLLLLSSAVLLRREEGRAQRDRWRGIDVVVAR